MADTGAETPKYEIRRVPTGRFRTGGRPVKKEVKIKIDPSNPANVPTQEQLPPQKPPEVIKKERREVGIESWQTRRDINND